MQPFQRIETLRIFAAADHTEVSQLRYLTDAPNPIGSAGLSRVRFELADVTATGGSARVEIVLRARAALPRALMIDDDGCIAQEITITADGDDCVIRFELVNLAANRKFAGWILLDIQWHTGIRFARS
jgi:hypothetical protein